jgi:hypothetical protein
MTMNQQGGNKKPDNFSDIKQEIRKQAADLRSSHFALGSEKGAAQSSSMANFSAPPTNLLRYNNTGREEVKNKATKTHFTIRDTSGNANQSPDLTTQQA